jgi:hypothetical protein
MVDQKKAIAICTDWNHRTLCLHITVAGITGDEARHLKWPCIDLVSAILLVLGS